MRDRPTPDRSPNIYRRDADPVGGMCGGAAMKSGVHGFGGSYGRWSTAQNAVSDYERLIFRPDHQLTADELARLQSLRRAAAIELHRLIAEVDVELGRLKSADNQSTFGAETVASSFNGATAAADAIEDSAARATGSA